MLIGDKSIGAGDVLVGVLSISGVALIVAVDAKLTDVMVVFTVRAVLILVEGGSEDTCVLKVQETRDCYALFGMINSRHDPKTIPE